MNVICVIKCSQSICCQSVLWNFCIFEDFLYTTFVTKHSPLHTVKNMLFCMSWKIFCYVAGLKGGKKPKTNNLHTCIKSNLNI